MSILHLIDWASCQVFERTKMEKAFLRTGQAFPEPSATEKVETICEWLLTGTKEWNGYVHMKRPCIVSVYRFIHLSHPILLEAVMSHHVLPVHFVYMYGMLEHTCVNANAKLCNRSTCDMHDLHKIYILLPILMLQCSHTHTYIYIYTCVCVYL